MKKEKSATIALCDFIFLLYMLYVKFYAPKFNKFHEMLINNITSLSNTLFLRRETTSRLIHKLIKNKIIKIEENKIKKI